ncbi:lysozyme inhibitor LprI family protein [Phenylobacterium aquaticum]|uniref:lysozyme inhibitor LprI family protein n=1 Tax=Phenylobacterium aquaticum TaxID=1763816 RepID=UPI0026EFDA74|nr:lysozyme inhibitor LprI family protein [Phenylobacterium aquaticum]
MRAILAVSILMASALTVPAVAGEPTRSAQFEECSNAPNSTTYSLRECYGAELKRQDARLNAAYAEALSTIDSAGKLKLRAAQRAWITFRDADCQAVFASYGGTMAPMMEDQCQLDRTSQRADDLEQFAKP